MYLFFILTFFINNVNDKLMNLVETLDQEKITDKIFFFSDIGIQISLQTK